MSFNFCPNCGTNYESVKNPFAPQTCASCGCTQYHNSKPCAGALVVKDGRVLLSKRGIEPFKGCWDIPGGFLEPGEHPQDGMLREIKEETGLDVRVIDLLGVYMDQYGDGGAAEWTLNFYYVVEPVSGEPRAADDVTELHWFPLEQLPEKMAFTHEYEVLRDLQEFAL
jgi:8-oxo-dGTP diphosphatase